MRLLLLCFALLTGGAHAAEATPLPDPATPTVTPTPTPTPTPTATPTGPGVRIRVLVLEPTGSTVEPSLRTAMAGLLTVELGRYEALDVVSADDMKKAVELEADKQLAGCTQSSCLAEIAGALGARLVVFGDAAQLGSVTVLTVNLYDSERGESAGRVAIQAAALEEIPRKIPEAVAELLAKKLEEIAPGSATYRPPTSSPMTARAATAIVDVLLVGATLGGMFVGTAVGFGAGLALLEAIGATSTEAGYALYIPVLVGTSLGGGAGAALGSLLFEPPAVAWVAAAAGGAGVVGSSLLLGGTLASYTTDFQALGVPLLVTGFAVLVVGAPAAAVVTANITSLE